MNPHPNYLAGDATDVYYHKSRFVFVNIMEAVLFESLVNSIPKV